ncbi:ATP-binding protein, partial [Streptomyces seoulensis]
PEPERPAAPVREVPAPPAEEVGGLPKRRRGRTLAEAERSRSGSRDDTARPAPGADEAKVRAARFSSFRNAVRPGTTPEGDAPHTRAGEPRDGGPADTPDVSHPRTEQHTHLEGDTTS